MKITRRYLSQIECFEFYLNVDLVDTNVPSRARLALRFGLWIVFIVNGTGLSLRLNIGLLLVAVPT